MGSLENSLTALGSFHYIAHVVLLILYVLLELVPTPKSKSDKKKEA